MAEPTDAELVNATKEVVRSLKRDGTIEKWTKGLLRERMEKQFNLPSGSLKGRKKLVEQATEEAINESDDEDKDEEQEVPKKKETKSSPKRPSNKKKRPSMELVSPCSLQCLTSDRMLIALLLHNSKPSDSELSVLDDASPAKAKKSKAKDAKPSSSKKKVSATTKVKRADKNTDTFLSMIGLAPGSKGADENAAALLVQGLTGGKVDLDDDDDLSELEDEPPRKKAKTKRSKSKKAAADSASASEEDPAPKKRSRKLVPTYTYTPRFAQQQKSEKSDKPMDKNEEEIKRLKSFVVACGVRKKWASPAPPSLTSPTIIPLTSTKRVKEFEGLTTPAQQINKLRKILADLGMTGRLSLEKAKEIREKREFAQEMEDIQEFNAKINGPREGRSSRSKAKSGGDNDEEMKNGDEGEGEGEDEDDSPGPSRPRKKGRSQLLAFLDDQSGSE
ncbi:hypothetical protein FRC04_007900 [Tulasnella sp. 424]|nr:hypothetical protein FRC04_007900 [Tulasnella sp. 424]